MKLNHPSLHVEVTKQGEIMESTAKLSGRKMIELPVPFKKGEWYLRVLRKHGELEI